MPLLVSIVIPTYNRAELLIRSLDSVKDQQYQPIEILVVDDGSTDNTAEAVRQWAEHNASDALKLLYFEKDNGGPSSARNLGVRHVSGDYVYFFDSDDCMHSNLLKDAVEVLQNEDSDCVVFGFDYESDTGLKKTYLPSAQPPLKSFLEGLLWGYTPSSLRSTSLVRSIGPWSESQKIGEDYEYLGRSLFNASKISVLRKSLFTVYCSHDSLGAEKETAAGLSHRLIAEESIVEQIQQRRDRVPSSWLSAYSGRLFKTAVNMYAKGENDFARKIGLLAVDIDAAPQRIRDRLIRLAWSKGRWSSLVWFSLSRFYSSFRAKII